MGTFLWRRLFLVAIIGISAGCGGIFESLFGDDENGSSSSGASSSSGGNLFDGGPSTEGGDSQSSSCSPNLTGVLRDFKGKPESGGHVDFENDAYVAAPGEKGIVQAQLGTDDKPVYNATGTDIAGQLARTSSGQMIHSTSGKAPFDQWFRDINGVNKREPVCAHTNAYGIKTCF